MKKILACLPVFIFLFFGKCLAQEICDTLIFKNGRTLPVVLLPGNEDEFFVKKCDETGETKFAIRREMVLKIKKGAPILVVEKPKTEVDSPISLLKSLDEKLKTNAKSETPEEKEPNKVNPARYVFWVKKREGTSPHRSQLLEIKDSSIVIYESFRRKTHTIPVENIQSIRFRKNGSVARGIFFGGLAGGILGTLLGFAAIPETSSNSFCCDFSGIIYPVYGGFIGIFTGATIGVFTGGQTIKIPIHGKKSNYQKNFKPRFF